MTLHVPAHPAGYTEHHYLRDALLFVAVVAAVLVVWAAAIALRPAVQTSTTPVTTTELQNAYRADERAAWFAPAGDPQVQNAYRVEERGLWAVPVGAQLWSDYRAEERAVWVERRGPTRE